MLVFPGLPGNVREVLQRYVDTEVDKLRRHKKLTAAEVKSLGPGKYSDGDGLYLLIRPDGGAQWTCRFTLWGRARETGLGSVRHMSLRQARIAAEDVRRMVREGVDPIKTRKLERDRLAGVENTLQVLANAAYEAHRQTLKHGGEDGKWFAPLRLYVLPKLGKMPITQIDQADIQVALKSAWQDRHETARKALSRLNTVFRFAIAQGHELDLQLIEKARILLGKVDIKRRNIPAMPWADVPDFYASLGDGVVEELALRFLMLTGVRSGSVLQMTFDQVDGALWTIPANNSKGRKGKTVDFDVPLSDEALHVLALARAQTSGDLVFPSLRGKVQSGNAMSNIMKHRGLAARPHGFRTSIRTWFSEETDIQSEVAEMVLQHAVGSEVERTYNRTTYLEKRRAPMQVWGSYVSSKKVNS